MNHALELWRGPALSGFEDVMTLHPTAIRLEERRLSVIEWRIEADLACGSGPDLVADLAELVAKYPLRERFRAQLMLALERSGRQAEALAAYRAAWQLLNRELGIEPGAELRRIHQAILNGRSASATSTAIHAP
jgi:DNA-binding SARP family transcriptional activator